MKKILYILLISLYTSLFAMDGTLDPSFGTGGVVSAPTGAFGVAVGVQTDGKIIVIGPAVTGDQIVRYNSDGTLDPTFGTGGIATNSGFVADLIILPDGKILVVGQDMATNIQLTQYNSNGTLDTTFGSGGIAIGPMGSAIAVALQTDSKIVIAGTNLMGGSLVVRYNPNGIIDTIFQSGPTGFAQDVIIQIDGKVVTGGINNATSFQLVRYNTDGTLDATFGAGGVVTGPVFSFQTGILLQPDGKLIATGYFVVFPYNVVMARYNSNGTLDATFGAGGVVSELPGSNVQDSILQPDGKIVLTGFNSLTNQFQLVRYNSNGTIDPTFGIGGITTGPGLLSFGAAIQQNGYIIATGSAPTFTTFQVARYINSPALEPTVILMPINNSTVTTGTVIVAGTAQNPSNVYIFLNGVLVGGAVTDSGGNDTWMLPITITTPGSYTIQAVSLYQDHSVNIASQAVTFNVVPPTTTLTATKTNNAPNGIHPGDTLVYTIPITNTGNIAAQGVSVIDMLPMGVTYISSSLSNGGITTNSDSVVMASVGSIAVNETVTLTIVVRVNTDAPAVLTNNAGIMSADAPALMLQNSTIVIPVVPPETTIIATKIDNTSGSAADCTILAYSIIVQNTGSAIAQNVVVTDILPNGVSFSHASASNSGLITQNQAVITAQLGTLVPGETVTVMLSVRIPLGLAGIITNRATVTSTNAPAVSIFRDTNIITSARNLLSTAIINKYCPC